MTYQGKCAIVTGGAQGIGLAVVEMILRKGGSVAILDISPREKFQWPTFDDTTQKLEYIQCDVSDQQQLIDCFKKAQEILGGQLDVVVNNAGIIDEVNWSKLIEINFTAMVRGTHIGINLMSKEQGGRGGVIINTASTIGIQNHHFLVYSAAKFGVRAFTSNFKLIRNFYEDHGIRVNCVCPGLVDTEMGAVKALTKDRHKCGTSLDLPMLSLLTKMEEGIGLNVLMEEPHQDITPALTPAQAAEMYEAIIDNESLHGESVISSTGEQKWSVH